MRTYWHDTQTGELHELPREPSTTPVYWNRITREVYRKRMRAMRNAWDSTERVLRESSILKVSTK